MKKRLSVLAVILFTILCTCGFVFAEAASTGISNFPFFQVGSLIVGGLIIVSLKTKYNDLYISECVGSFALYTLFVSLFTDPVILAIKDLVS
jgi:hypothetical protein